MLEKYGKIHFQYQTQTDRVTGTMRPRPDRRCLRKLQEASADLSVGYELNSVKLALTYSHVCTAVEVAVNILPGLPTPQRLPQGR